MASHNNRAEIIRGPGQGSEGVAAAFRKREKQWEAARAEIVARAMNNGGNLAPEDADKDINLLVLPTKT